MTYFKNLIKTSIASLFLLTVNLSANESCCTETLNKGVQNTLNSNHFEKITSPDLGNPNKQNDAKPLKALLIAGGCCHDYAKQTKILSEGIQQRSNIQVDVYWTRDQGHDPHLPLFEDPNWAQGYDLIIHDECAALKKDSKVLENILNVHKTIPAVHLHCAVHSFRASDNQWHEHIGLSSDRHGPHVPVAVEILEPKHPIVKNIDSWVTGPEELYNNKEIYGAKAIAMGTQKYKRNGKEIVDKAIVAWINTSHGAPSFTTSMGHFNDNVSDPRYLEMVSRGALWTTGKLDQPAYHKAFTGQNKFTEIPFDTLLKTTAESTQDQRDAFYAIDGDPETRWCASSAKTPSWYQIQFKSMTVADYIEIDWEIQNQWVQYTIETSRDGKKWKTVLDASKNTKPGSTREKVNAKYQKYLKINILKQQNGMWPSIREIRLYDQNQHPLNLKEQK